MAKSAKAGQPVPKSKFLLRKDRRSAPRSRSVGGVRKKALLAPKVAYKKSIFQTKVAASKRVAPSKSEPKKHIKRVTFGKATTRVYKATKKTKTIRMKVNRREKDRSERESVKSKSGMSQASKKAISALSSSHPYREMSLRPKDEDDLAENLLQTGRTFTRKFVRNIHKSWLHKYHPNQEKKDWLIDHINKTLKNNRGKSTNKEVYQEKDDVKQISLSRVSKHAGFAKPKRVYRSKKSIRDNLQSQKVALMWKVPMVVYKNPQSFIGDSGCLGFNLVESDIEDYRKPVKRPFNRKKVAEKKKKEVQVSDSDSDECSSEREYRALASQMTKKESMKKVTSLQFMREFQEYLRKVKGKEAYDFPNLGKLTLVDAEAVEAGERESSASGASDGRAKASVAASLERQRQALQALKAAKQSQRAQRHLKRADHSETEAPQSRAGSKRRGRKPLGKKIVKKTGLTARPKPVTQAVEIVKKPRGRPRKNIETKLTEEQANQSKKVWNKKEENVSPKKDKLEKIRESVSKRHYVEDNFEQSKVKPKKNEGELLGKRKSVSPLHDNRNDSTRKVLVDANRTTAASNKKPGMGHSLLQSPGFMNTVKKEGLESQRLFLEDLPLAQNQQTRKKSLDERVNFEESAYKLQQVTVKKGEEGVVNIKESLSKIFDRIGNEKGSLDKGKLSLKMKENLHNEIRRNGNLTDRSQNVIQDILKRSIIKSIKKSETKEALKDQERLNSILRLPEATTRFEEILKPHGGLTLPTSYQRLLQKFEQLDTILNFMNMKQTPTYLGVVSTAFNSSINQYTNLIRSLDSSDVKQMLAIWPAAYNVTWERHTLNDCELELKLAFPLTPDRQKLSAIILNKTELGNRKAEFEKMLIRYAKLRHSDLLRRIEEPSFDPERHGRWHPAFNLESETVQPTSFPPRPVITNQVPMKKFYDLGNETLLQMIQKYKKSQQKDCFSDTEENRALASLPANAKTNTALLDIVIFFSKDQRKGENTQPEEGCNYRKPLYFKEV
jgi:hypothetical protein